MSDLIVPVTEAERREQARVLAMYGVPEEMIARRLRMPLAELKRRYAEELSDGNADGVVTALSTLYRLATGREVEGPDGEMRTIGADKDALKFYLRYVSRVAGDGPAPGTAPKHVGEEVARQIIKTVVGSPEEVAQFLLMRRKQQQEEDRGDSLTIDGERVDF